MAFDIEGAKKAGYSPQEIADFLGQTHKFDVGGARKSGYNDDEIIGFLAKKQADEAMPKEKGVVGKALDQLAAGPETAANLLSGAVGQLAGGAVNLRDMLSGQLTKNNMMDAKGEEVANALTYQPRSDSGKQAVDMIQKGFGAVAKAAGQHSLGFQEKARSVVGAEPMTDLEKEKATILGETIGEVGMNFLPLPIAGKVVRGSKGRKLDVDPKMAEQQAKIEALKQQKEAGEGYQRALTEMDAEMVKYPKDMQAPQVGLGGARQPHPDGVATKLPNRTSFVERQRAYDDDMARISDETKQADTTYQQGITRDTPVPEVTPPAILGDTWKPVVEAGKSDPQQPAIFRPFEQEQPKPPVAERPLAPDPGEAFLKDPQAVIKDYETRQAKEAATKAEEKVAKLEERVKELQRGGADPTKAVRLDATRDALAKAKSELDSVYGTVTGGKPGGRQSGAFDPSVFGEGISKLLSKVVRKRPEPKVLPKSNKTVASVAEAAKERTPFAELKKRAPDILTEEIPDGIINTPIRELTNNSFMAHFTDSKFVRWASESIQDIVRGSEAKALQVKNGEIYGLDRIGKAVIDPKSPRGLWDTITKREKADVAKLANEFGGRYKLTKEEILNLGMSEGTARAYLAFDKAFRTAIDDVNSFRDRPISTLEGYFPRARFGDWKVTVTDKSGKVVWADLFMNKHGAKRIAAELREKFPEGEFTISDPKALQKDRGNPYNTSTVPFEELLQTIKRDDPRREAVISAIKEIKSKRGFGRHSIKREFVEGGDLTPDNFYKTFEHYIDSAYRHKANLEMEKMAKEVRWDTDFQNAKAKDWLNDAVSFSKGANGKIAEYIDAVANIPAKMLGFGPTATRRTLAAANNYFMMKALFFFRPGFLVSQMVQPIAFGPQWAAHYRLKGKDGGSFTKAYYEAEKGLMSGDPGLKDFINNYMLPRGSISPDLVHSMSLFGKDMSHSKLLRQVTGQSVAQSIESFGRIQTAASGYYFFKSAGLKGKDLYKQAEQFTNDVMVDYSRQEAPKWVNKLGVLGQAMGPLTTFQTHFWSTFGLFAKDILDNPKNPKAYAPMAMQMAQTALWGGLTGTLLLKEADFIIDFLNAMHIPSKLHKAGLLEDEERWPTLTERILTNDNIPDFLAFGPFALLPGSPNFAASMAAPEMRLPFGDDFNPMNTVPGLNLVGQLATSFYEAVGNGTEAEWKKFAKTALPNMAGKIVDVLDDSGDIKEVAHNDRGQATVELTDERVKARLMGSTSTSEVRERLGERTSKEDLKYNNEIKNKVLGLYVDEVMQGEGKHDLGELAERLNALGMTDKAIDRAVTREIKEREVVSAERNVGRMTTPTQQRKYDIQESFKR
jgi:hypothetical protein